MFVNPRARPLLIYDGSCGFCRRWIGRWKAITGDAVEYAPYQDVAPQFPQIPESAFQTAVQLVDLDGRVLGGAAAALKAISYGPSRGAGWWAYERVPAFAWVSERVYRFVARRRDTLSWLTDLLWGRNVEPPTYFLTRSLFLRLVGVVYLIAFISMGVQVRGLIGEEGILPAAEYLEHVREQYVQRDFAGEELWRFPTLAWWNAGDGFLQGVLCGGGALLALVLIAGLFPLPVLILLWMFYLSLYTAGQVFTGYQWDILLLETGLLSIFFAPLSWRMGAPGAMPPSRIVLFLLRWLLFRLMFLSGLVKLTWGDPCWQDLTALSYHYETQPIPTWTAWYMHYLPMWAHQASTAVMFFIEMVLPFFVFGPRRLRYLAALGIFSLMSVVAATGNYNFFNLLTAVLCVNLLDDQWLRRMLPAKARERLAKFKHPPQWRIAMRTTVVVPAAVVLFSMSVVKFVQGSVPRRGDAAWYQPAAAWLGTTIPNWYESVAAKVEPLRSVNAYGLFRHMTKERPEIVIEGSENGIEWSEYEFYWKPGDVLRRPGFVAPHQPRLDWQMWFAALNPRGHAGMMHALLRRIQQGSEPVLEFFAVNPFPDKAPAYLRAIIYDYHFTDPQTRSQTGAWWRRELKGVYIRPTALPADSSSSESSEAATAQFMTER